MSQKIVKSREFLSSSSDSSSSDNDNENVTPSQLHKKYEKTKKPQVKKVDKKRKEQLKSIGEDSDSSSDGEDRDGGKHEPPKKLSKIEKIKSSQKSIQKSKSEEKIEEPKEKKKDKKEKTEKKQKKETNSSVNKDTYQVQLGNSGKKYVRYNSFKGTSYCDIRELYEKDGKLCPGAKGISLKKEIVEVLFEEETKEKVKENLDALRGGAKETPVFALGGSKIKMGIRKFKVLGLFKIDNRYVYHTQTWSEILNKSPFHDIPPNRHSRILRRQKIRRRKAW